MKRIIHAAILSFSIIAANAAPALAEDTKPAGLNPDELKKALGLTIYVQGGYTYNGNASSTGKLDDTGNGEQNDLRVFDHKANSFSLDLAQIIFQKDPAPGAVGYKVKFSAGETAKLIHAAGMGADNETFDVTEAYLSYTAAIGKGVRFDLGKYVTYHGAEVIEAIDNPNYSRSFLFNYAIPFTHTGAKVSYPFTDSLAGTIHVVNGWDNSTDNNKAKSYILNLGYTPLEQLALVVNYMTGPEQDKNSSNTRNLIDVVATIKPVKPLSIILNYDNAKEEMGAGAPDVKWSGLAGIVKYDISNTYSVAVRAEYFDDKDGVRTGTAQKLKEVTVTPEIRLNGGVVLRPEYRHDISNEKSFDNGTKKNQDTIALGAMYRW